MSDQYPKMKTVMVTGKAGVKHAVPLIYPAGHLKAGQHVIFEDAKAEKTYDNTGVTAARRTEQAPSPNYSYSYNPWDPWA